ncbi:TetR/AcrR family transcriptional regulator [Bradyrhizobium commune]|uniref:TetR/AcrR family transcriptional regulator n=1 Tax=Bradyrhizobium commune TaxID=83627 RepID=A0A7S9CZX0_9BRAD|nr:TetR/AcrR family transcriptional regulator [Bradyrhizobium commune]QPF88631.1 TetR/AcrR family transcriptional regulator [Bradyrhizobium commune]
MPEQTTERGRASFSRARIIEAAIRLYRDIGYKKTTVADIARRASMSSTNVYRFFSSRQAIEEAVVGTLLEKVSEAAAHAARSSGSALQRLSAALKAISDLHADRAANDSKLHELVGVAVRESWPITLSHADRIRGIVRPVIAAGQAASEVRQGSPMTLACCLLEAMDAYLSPLRITACTVRPTFNEMMDYSARSLCSAARGEAIELQPAEESLQLPNGLQPAAVATGPDLVSNAKEGR